MLLISSSESKCWYNKYKKKKSISTTRIQKTPKNTIQRDRHYVIFYSQGNTTIVYSHDNQLTWIACPSTVYITFIIPICDFFQRFVSYHGRSYEVQMYTVKWPYAVGASDVTKRRNNSIVVRVTVAQRWIRIT